MTNMPTIRDFSENMPTTSSSHAGIVESARAGKETEASVLMAKKFPRNEQAAYNRIINSCSRPSLAQKSIYSFKRGGQKVEGPSIRLAEVIARSWGNLQFGVKEVERRSNMSVVEAYCWDMESNTRSSKEFSVMHIRDTKDGPKPLLNERDIYETVANQGARRLRNCILSCIPEDIVDNAVQAVNETLIQAAKGNAVDMQAKIRSMVEAFQAIGVTREQLEIYLNTKVEAATAKQIVDLGKIYSSIKEEYSEVKDWFKINQTSIVEKIKSEDDQKTIDDNVEKLERLMVQAQDAGVPQSALDKINPDLSKPSKVTQAIDFLTTIMSDRLVEMKRGEL